MLYNVISISYKTRFIQKQKHRLNFVFAPDRDDIYRSERHALCHRIRPPNVFSSNRLCLVHLGSLYLISGATNC